MLWHLFIGLLLFLIPTNWFLQLTNHYQYLAGIRVDYLIPKLYPLEFVLLGFICVSLIATAKTKKHLTTQLKQHSLLLSFILVGVFFQLTSAISVLAFNWLIKLLLIAISTLILVKQSSRIPAKTILHTLQITTIFQSVVALWQFWKQHSVAGYWFLGETNLQNFTNISKTTIAGSEYIAAYGTTAHPNILAGILAVFIPLLLVFSKVDQSKYAKTVTILALLSGCLALLVTFSISGWLTLLTASLVLLWKKTPLGRQYMRWSGWLFSISIVLTLAGSLVAQSNMLSIERRLVLAQAALQMWLAQPLFGVGLGQFTYLLEKFDFSAEVVRFVQPVHHVGLLWLAETGLWGVGLLWKVRRYVAVAIAIALPSLVWDHYWLTQFNMLVLLTLLPILVTISTTKE